MKNKHIFAIVLGLWWVVYLAVLHPGAWPFAIFFALIGYFIGSPLDNVKISTISSRRRESFLRFMIVAGLFDVVYFVPGVMLVSGFGADVLVFGIPFIAIIVCDFIVGLVSLAVYSWAVSNKDKFPKVELIISIILFITLFLPLCILLAEAS